MLATLSEDQILEYLRNWLSKLNLYNIFVDFGRKVGWIIVKLLTELNSVLTEGMSSVYKVTAFWKYDKIANWLSSPTVQAVVWTLFTLSIIYVGYTFIFKGEEADAHSTLRNIIFSLIMFFGLPFIVDQSINFASGIDQAFNAKPEATSLQIVQANVSDLFTIDSKVGWNTKADDKKEYNDIKTKEDLYTIDIGEPMPISHWYSSDTGLSDDGDEVLTHKIYNSNGKQTLVELDTSLIGFDETYFRYSWHPFIIILSLLALSIVLCGSIAKTFYLIYQIGYLNMAAAPIFMGDAHSGGRTRAWLVAIRDTLFSMFFVSMSITYYSYLVSFVSQDSLGLNGPMRVLAILIGAMFVLKGPTKLAEILNLDVSLGGKGAIFGALAAGHGIKRLAQGGFRGAKNVTDNVTNLGADLLNKGSSNMDKKMQDQTPMFSGKNFGESTPPEPTEIPAAPQQVGSGNSTQNISPETVPANDMQAQSNPASVIPSSNQGRTATLSSNPVSGYKGSISSNGAPHFNSNGAMLSAGTESARQQIATTGIPFKGSISSQNVPAISSSGEIQGIGNNSNSVDTKTPNSIPSSVSTPPSLSQNSTSDNSNSNLSGTGYVGSSTIPGNVHDSKAVPSNISEMSNPSGTINSGSQANHSIPAANSSLAKPPTSKNLSSGNQAPSKAGNPDKNTIGNTQINTVSGKSNQVKPTRNIGSTRKSTLDDFNKKDSD